MRAYFHQVLYNYVVDLIDYHPAALMNTTVNLQIVNSKPTREPDIKNNQAIY